MLTVGNASAQTNKIGEPNKALLLREESTITNLSHKNNLLDRLSPRELQIVLRAAADKLEELI